MRFTSKEYRDEAARLCKKQEKVLILIALIYLAINALINFSYSETYYIGDTEFSTTVTPFGFLSIFITGHIAVSFINIGKKLYEDKEVEVKDFFYGFKDYLRIFIVTLLQTIYIALWSLLFVIPGIIKSYSYSMTYFLMENDKELTSNEAITLSRKLMDGNKWRLFCLHFSYFGWLILCALTFGILSLWVMPKMQTAEYLFFRDIYEEAGYHIEEEHIVTYLAE